MPSSLHIAVIDDEDGVRKALRRLLCSAGMRVETFTGGAEFLNSLEGHRPDCAVLDLHMPNFTGLEVLARLAETQVKLPVIVVTGNDSPEAETSVLSGGAFAYLRKPIPDGLLLNTIAAAVACARSALP